MKGASEARGSLRTQERRQGPGKAGQAPGGPQAHRASAGWKMRLWCRTLWADLAPRPGGRWAWGVLLGMKPPFSGSKAMSRRHEIQAETRPMGESLQSAPRNIPQVPPGRILGLGEYCKCLRMQPSLAAQTSWLGCQEGVPRFRWGAGRSFWQREMVGETPRSGCGQGSRLAAGSPEVGRGNTPCDLSLGEALRCSYPSRGSRGQ